MDASAFTHRLVSECSFAWTYLRLVVHKVHARCDSSLVVERCGRGSEHIFRCIPASLGACHRAWEQYYERCVKDARTLGKGREGVINSMTLLHEVFKFYCNFKSQDCI